MPNNTPRIVRSVGATTGGSTPRGFSASTSSEIDNLRVYVDNKFAVTEAKVDGLRSEMKGEIATVMAEFRTAESKRSSDFDLVQRDFKDMQRNLPTKDDITRSTRNWALLVGGFFVALLTLLWMFFDTGTGVTGAVASHIVDAKEIESAREAEVREIKALIQDLHKEQANDDSQRGSGAGQTGQVHQGTKP